MLILDCVKKHYLTKYVILLNITFVFVRDIIRDYICTLIGCILLNKNRALTQVFSLFWQPQLLLFIRHKDNLNFIIMKNQGLFLLKNLTESPLFPLFGSVPAADMMLKVFSSSASRVLKLPGFPVYRL